MIEPKDSAGRARAVTVITAVRPLCLPFTRLALLSAKVFPKTMGIRALGSVYFTRWSIVTRLPQAHSRLPRPLLLWESNYSAPLEPYIESFAYLIGRQIRWTWGSSYGFPGVQSITSLKAYIDRLHLPGSYYYAAYPEASVRMVLSALKVAREHDFLLQAARESSPEEFAVIYRGFLSRRQSDL